MIVLVHVCAGCQVPGRHPAGRCWHCRAAALALNNFGNELGAELREREQRVRQRGFGDSVGLLVRIRELLAGQREVRP